MTVPIFGVFFVSRAKSSSRTASVHLHRRRALEKRDSHTLDVGSDFRIGAFIVNDQAETVRQQEVVERVVNLADDSPIQTDAEKCEIDVRSGFVRGFRA